MAKQLFVFEVKNAWDSENAVNVQYVMNGKPYLGQYRTATSAEIDAAASEQMRQDAEVGRAISFLPEWMTFEYDGVKKAFRVFSLEPDAQNEQVFEGKTPRLALLAAGLLKEVTP
jgi:hypothetical protein